jgi:hypothetical protein
MWLVPSKGLLLYILLIPNHLSTSFNACNLCIRKSEAADLRTSLLPFLLRNCYKTPILFCLPSELRI